MASAEDGEGPLGELELIETYFRPLAEATPGALRLADDAACLPVNPSCDLVATTDMLVAGVHFFPDDAPADIAWKAVAVNVSDLAAKGARPLAYLLALALPGAPRRDWMEGFADGLRQAQTAFAIGLAGGDTTATAGPLTISITALGETPRGAMLRRGGARAGDGIFVSGALGDAALGLKLRREVLHGKAGLVDAAVQFLISRYLRPHPRIGLAKALLEHAGAAMDISDGLLLDLSRMCRASGGLGAEIRMADVPLSKAAADILAKAPGEIKAILTGGDDYEILAAIRPEAEAAFVAAALAAGVGVTKIGSMLPSGGVRVLAPDGSELQFANTGYQHFG